VDGLNGTLDKAIERSIAPIGSESLEILGLKTILVPPSQEMNEVRVLTLSGSLRGSKENQRMQFVGLIEMLEALVLFQQAANSLPVDLILTDKIAKRSLDFPSEANASLLGIRRALDGFAKEPERFFPVAPFRGLLRLLEHIRQRWPTSFRRDSRPPALTCSKKNVIFFGNVDLDEFLIQSAEFSYFVSFKRNFETVM
jgi:hypothetical protein